MSCTPKCQHVRPLVLGSSRSIVRKIGSWLPRYSGKRLVVELSSPNSNGLDSLEGLGDTSEGLVVASHLKDLSTLDANAIELESIMENPNGFGDCDIVESPEQSDGKEETLRKISSLESELAALKSQIATYALLETEKSSSFHLPPPPPPPPLPSTMPLPVANDPAALRHANPRNGKDLSSVTPLKTDMSSVLKDIGSVKLKAVAVARSPGGTPLQRGQNNCHHDDPGAIIARALRAKFSNRVFQDSPDKENLDHSDTSHSFGFESPVSKLAYQAEVDAT